MVNTTQASGQFVSSIEPVLPPYDPYDPEQNELLKLEPAKNSPFASLEKALHFLQVVPPVIDNCLHYIVVRNAMTLAEYVTSYSYRCNNPIQMTEQPTSVPVARHDFSIKVSDVSKTYDGTKAPSKRPVPA